jgi:hypothetical protein
MSPTSNVVRASTAPIELFANLVSGSVRPGRFAADAEAAGFHGVTCSDHYWLRGTFPHVWVALAEMACRTERVTLAPSFVNNLLRSPFEFVQASVAMHHLSGGRYEAGLGAGWTEHEIVATGQVYPDGPTRARRFREALVIARQLFTTGACQFEGEHYRMDVPELAELRVPDMPLVASVGGPWTMRNITPLVDRVELKFGASTRGGTLDMSALAAVTLDELKGMVATVQDAKPGVPMGIFLLIAVGDEATVGRIRAIAGDAVWSGFVGEPKRVLENLRGLGELGIGRVQLTELVPGSLERLSQIL